MKISVITACYNSAKTIGHTLRSVGEQTYGNVEHIVVDGGSADKTLEIVKAAGSRVSRTVSEPDEGIYDALNKGILMASGDAVGFLHADDVYAGPDVLARVAALLSNPKVSAVYGDLQYVRRDDPDRVVRNWVSSPFKHRQLSLGWMPPHPTMYARREWFARIGGFDTSYRIAADYFSILRLFSMPGFNAVYLPEVMVRMRLGGASNRTLTNIVLKSREDLRALRQSGVGGLGALVAKNFRKLGQFL